MKKLIFFIQIILVLFFVSTVKAAECSVAGQCYCRFYPDGQAGAVGGNVTMSTSCAIYGDVDGVVAGNLTILPNTTITLHKTLVFSPGYSVNVQTGGIIYINTGGMMKQGQICVKDNDNDGYAETKILDKDPYGVALEIPITQIDQIFSEGSCSAPYRLRANMNDLTMVDNDPNSTDVTRLSTSDREMLRLGFELNGITDVEAAVGDVQIIDKNLLVCTSTGCPATTFNPLKGNLYVASKVGIGITNPTYPLDVTGNSRVTGTLNVSSTVTAPTFAGNATTATTLKTARTIWGQSFNGSANVSGALSGATTGSFSSTVTAPTFSGALSGNATTATNATYTSYQSATGNNNDWVQAFQQTPVHSTSFREMSAGGPTGSWWLLQNLRHSNASNYWGTQIAWGWEDNANQMYTRNVQSNTFGSWVKYINSANIGSQSVNYANSAGAAYPYRVGGVVMQFNWSGQGGQPNWLWGGGDGTNMYVYNPSNFSVYYASIAGTAGNVSGGVVSATTGNFSGKVCIGSGNCSAGENGDLVVGRVGRVDGAIWFGSARNYLYLDVNSNFNKTGAAGWIEGSDKRIKTEIQPLSYGLNEILQLQPKTYNLHNDYSFVDGKLVLTPKSTFDMGLIAQDVYNIIPEIVTKPPDETSSIWTMNYAGLTPILINAVQEQQTEIESLKQQVTDLNQRLINIESKLK